MKSSRAFRKATSFVTVFGKRFRLTTGFKADLATLISCAQNADPAAAFQVCTVDGTTPMTLSEMLQLRDEIVSVNNKALETEFTAQGS